MTIKHLFVYRRELPAGCDRTMGDPTMPPVGIEMQKQAILEASGAG